MTKLHLGCGGINLPGWINVDLDSPVADVIHDLRRPLPFEDESADLVFAEHFIEHLTYEEALGFLKECRRVLRKEGVLRFTTPDLMHLVRAYVSGEVTAWGDLWQPGDPCELMNQAFRFWGHQYVYDYPAVRKISQAAGFTKCERVTWQVSKFEQLSGIESRPFNGEIIVEASHGTASEVCEALQTEDFPRGVASAVEVRFNAALAAQAERIAALVNEVTEQRKNAAYILDLRNHISNQESALERQAEVIAHLESLLRAGNLRDVRNA